MKKYIINLLIGLDQFWNAILGGDPDETISSRIGKVKVKCGGSIPWSRPLYRIIDSGLEIIDKNHSLEAIEKDEGENQIIID